MCQWLLTICYHPSIITIGCASIWIPQLNGIMICSGGDQIWTRDSPIDIELYVPSTNTLTLMEHWNLPVPCQYPDIQLIDAHILVLITNTRDNLNRPGNYGHAGDETPGYITDLSKHSIDQPLSWLPLPLLGPKPSLT
jgi:hypothetical protein